MSIHARFSVRRSQAVILGRDDVAAELISIESSSPRNGRCASMSRGNLGKTGLEAANECIRQALTGAIELIPRGRSSFTGRSCSVPFICSTRPPGWLVCLLQLNEVSPAKPASKR